MESLGTVGRTEICVWQGDIATLDADAVVNAANNHLWMGGGVAGALKRGGGSEVEREAVSRGPIEVGEAVATTAGSLPAKRVIHAAVMGQDLRTNAEAIGRATTAALQVAADEGLASIALPALGTGVGGFPKQEAARVMVRSTIEYLKGRARSLERVVFALFDGETAEVFSGEIADQLGRS